MTHAGIDPPAGMLGHPAMHFVFDTRPNSPTLRRWHRTYDYDVWTDCRRAEEPALHLWEAHGAGVVRVPEPTTLLHVIRGGVPHHVEGLFGYWRECDSDIVWVRTHQADRIHYAMILGGCPGAYEKDAILWICPFCAHRFGRQEIPGGRDSRTRFWRREAEIVAGFNADEIRRRCERCGKSHPPAYAFRLGDEAAAAAVGRW